MIRDEFIDAGAVRIHCAVSGTADRCMLLLHGFPDFWRGWSRQLDYFGNRFTVVAPDGRGCNLSDKPADVQAYALRNLVEDARQLALHYGRGKPVVVAGHDWGGVVAWSLASWYPALLSHLVVLNAPHPRVIARALAEDPEQQLASEYMQRLRSTGAESLLSADGYARLRAALATLLAAGHLSGEDVAAYVEAWSRPGALTGALNWYRANDFGPGGEVAATVPALVMTPTLLIWGRDDTALLPKLADAHHAVAATLSVRILEGAGHWTQMQRAAEVHALVDAHVGGD